jgi:hypothetical protein
VSADDFNFWGVTFSPDSSGFYATLATAGLTYLVRGDIASRTATRLRTNVECPSLSPDGGRVAFKKRVAGRGGRSTAQLHVLDLASMTEIALGHEVRDVDDQLEWLDLEHVLYGHPEPDGRTSIWRLRADGRDQPTRYLPLAESPAVVRP